MLAICWCIFIILDVYFSLSTRDKVLSATEKTQKGLVFSVERFLFSLDSVDFLGWLLSKTFLYQELLYHTLCVPRHLSFDQGYTAYFLSPFSFFSSQLLARTTRAEAQVFLSPPFQHFNVNTAEVLNQPEQHWVQHKLTSLFFQHSGCIL